MGHSCSVFLLKQSRAGGKCIYQEIRWTCGLKKASLSQHFSPTLPVNHPPKEKIFMKTRDKIPDGKNGGSAKGGRNEQGCVEGQARWEASGGARRWEHNPLDAACLGRRGEKLGFVKMGRDKSRPDLVKNHQQNC